MKKRAIQIKKGIKFSFVNGKPSIHVPWQPTPTEQDYYVGPICFNFRSVPDISQESYISQETSYKNRKYWRDLYFKKDRVKKHPVPQNLLRGLDQALGYGNGTLQEIKCLYSTKNINALSIYLGRKVRRQMTKHSRPPNTSGAKSSWSPANWMANAPRSIPTGTPMPDP